MAIKLVLGVTSPGSYPLLKGQVSFFVDKGYKVYLMSKPREDVLEFCKNEGCEHVSISIERVINPLKDIKALFQIIIALNKIKPDIINVGTPKMGLLGMIGAFLLQIKRRIYTARGFRYEHEKGFTKKYLMFAEYLAGKLAHKVICVGPTLREKAIQDGIFSLTKTVVIGNGSSNGVDLNHFSPEKIDFKKSQKLKNILQLDKYFVFGFVGRMVDRKGVVELYNVFSKLYKENNQIRLLMVGTIEKNQLTYPEVADKLVEHPGVKWVGWQNDVPLYMSIMNVFVLPSWWEGFGNVYIQSAAMGLPIIATTGTGCRDTVKNGYNAIVIDVKNEKQLEEAMRTFLINDGLRKEYGSNSLLWAKNFHGEIIWNGLHDLYQKMLNIA